MTRRIGNQYGAFGGVHRGGKASIRFGESLQGDFTPLDIGDIGAKPHGAAVAGPCLAHLRPGAVGKLLLKGPCGVPVARETLFQPRFASPKGAAEGAALRLHAQQILEFGARNHRVGVPAEKLLVALVTRGQRIISVPKNKPVSDRLQRICKDIARILQFPVGPSQFGSALLHAALQLVLRLFQRGFCAQAGDMGFDPCDQRLRFKRFGDIVVGAASEAFGDFVAVGLRCHHDNGQLGRASIRTNGGQHFMSAGQGHNNVQQNQVEVVLVEQVRHLPAVARCGHVIAGALQPPGKQVTAELIVIDNQNRTVSDLFQQNFHLDHFLLHDTHRPVA